MSFVWNFFKKSDGKRSECILCRAEISRRDSAGHISTGSVANHLRSKHSITSSNFNDFGIFNDHNGYNQILVKSNQADIKSFCSKKLQTNDVIAELIAQDGLTMNQLVNSKFFRLAFEKFNLELPRSPSAITKVLNTEAQKHSHLQEILLAEEDQDYLTSFLIVY